MVGGVLAEKAWAALCAVASFFFFFKETVSLCFDI
jgi:hypothetical protein